MGLIDNVRSSIDSMGQVEMSGVKLETADVRLLDVGSLDLNQHVAMQPSAIAYYGAMKAEAVRNLASLKRAFERWEKKQYAMAKAAVTSGTAQGYKPTVADIESRYIVDNETALESWDKKIDKAREDVDTLEAWYDAWRQKSFALQQHVSVEKDERYSGGGSVVEQENSKPLSSDQIRSIIRARK